MKRFLVIVGLLFVAGVVIAGVLYVTFPVQMTTYGGMGLNFLKTLSTPAGTLTVETSPAYKPPTAARPSPPLGDAAWPNAAVGDWPSYNRSNSDETVSGVSSTNPADQNLTNAPATANRQITIQTPTSSTGGVCF